MYAIKPALCAPQSFTLLLPRFIDIFSLANFIMSGADYLWHIYFLRIEMCIHGIHITQQLTLSKQNSLTTLMYVNWILFFCHCTAYSWSAVKFWKVVSYTFAHNFRNNYTRIKDKRTPQPTIYYGQPSQVIIIGSIGRWRRIDCAKEIVQPLSRIKKCSWFAPWNPMEC